MKNLKFLPLPNSIFNIQKCYFPEYFLIENNILIGNFIIIEFNEEIKAICQCFLSENHASFSEVDLSVKQISMQKHGLLKNEIPDKNSTIKNIKITTPAKINTVEISIILKDFDEIQKYKCELILLKNIIRNLLKLFVFSNNCIINLNNLSKKQRLGIQFIIIHKIDNENFDKIGKIYSKTKINIIKILTESSYNKIFNKYSIKRLGGLTRPYEKLLNIINTNRNYLSKNIFLNNNKVLITGPTGSGKTCLVKLISEEKRIPLFTLSGTEFIDNHPGESEKNLRNFFEEADYLGKEIKDLTIVFLDQIDALCPKNIFSSEATRRITYQLFYLLDQLNNTKNVIFISTALHKKNINPRLLRSGRLDNEIMLSVPNQDEREEIIKILVPWISFSNSIASMTPGYVGGDLELLCQNVILNLIQNGSSHTKATLKDFKKVLSLMRPASLKDGLGIVLSKSKSISSLGGLEEVKKQLYRAILLPLKNADAFNRFSLDVPKGILLYGPPGCAKTSLAYAVATEAGCTFLAVSAADLYSPYVGEAEQTVVELFERARSAPPAVIFIDEIDAIVGNRGDNNQLQSVSHKVLTSLLVEMDGIQDTSGNHTIVIAATNRPEALDPAILRPGRFDRTIYVGPPNKNDRRDILTKLTKSTPIAADLDFDSIAEKTHSYSGADLKALVQEAALLSLVENGMNSKEVNSKHFEQALNIVPSSLESYDIK